MSAGEEPILNVARSLLSAADPSELARALLLEARRAVGADWGAVWTCDRQRRSFRLELDLPAGAFTPLPRKAGRRGDLLAETAAREGPVIRRGDELGEAALQHLGPAGGPAAQEVLCVAFAQDGDRLGILELVRGSPTPAGDQAAQARFLSACSTLASSAAASVARLQAARERPLGAIDRLTQLYDVSRVFHSTLERDALLPIIANRIGLILEAPEVRIWLPAGDGQGLLRATPGEEGETERLEPGDALPWTVFQSRESALAGGAVEDGTEEASAGGDPAGASSPVVCAPLLADDACLGVVEAGRRPGESPFGEDDRDFLEELCRQAAIALRNANLFQAESRARELDALLEISREITSTLDLDHVLSAIVNRADGLVPCERCAILLAEGTKLELRAVSGRLEVDRKDPAIRDLEETLAWTHLGGQGLYISELDGEIEAEREETREKFRRYFDRSGMKTFIAFPLRDEEGLLGTLALESSQPYFVPEEKLETLNILANQATVAIRNASLYRQIPLINIMQPIASWRKRLGTIPRWRWLRNAGYAAALVAVLVLAPWNLKVAGRVVLLPARNSSVTAEVAGIVDAVYRREGDRVRKGDLLASLVDRDYRLRLEEARARYEIADREVAQFEAGLDRAAARQARIRREQLKEELDLLRQEVERTRILSPVDGVLLTPRLEQKVGSFLERGEVLCRIADMQEVAVEILVPETEIAEVRAGQKIRLKMDSFPTRTFIGRVEIVGQQVMEGDGGRSLVVRGRLEGGDLPLKTGMLGRAKIEAGRRSLGYVLLRQPVRFLWRHLWAWMP